MIREARIDFDFRRQLAEKVEGNLANFCYQCGACVGECPVDAISEGTPYVIDAATCIDCGACAAVCPVSAIEAP